MTQRDATGDRPIQVGDLVQVINDCCDQVLLGDVGSVEYFLSHGMHCKRCGMKTKNATAVVSLRRGKDNLPLTWLKRIPPLSELEGQRTEESTKEPA